jgi:hypothetical protein
MCTKHLSENFVETDHLGKCGLTFPGSGYGPVLWCPKHRNEPTDFIQGAEYLAQFSDYQLLEKNFASWNI